MDGTHDPGRGSGPTSGRDAGGGRGRLRRLRDDRLVRAARPNAAAGPGPRRHGGSTYYSGPRPLS